MKVLVVDDDPIFLRAVVRQLRAYDVEVRTATGMRHALRELTEIRPDVLISDLDLGDGTGFEVAARLRQIEAAVFRAVAQLLGRDPVPIRVVLLSAAVTAAREAEALKLGGRLYDKMDLRSAVAAATVGAHPVTPEGVH